ncbi:nuclear transport factor 2 family protein [Roseivirga sp. E12]|uniref:nuclear transport factor 2 family protein n=1 Tax=Roseivirga sp. E12 TaxID=2819237 RepID=UPI001ABC71CA|nr:nuclear transport factor 2 family protein [Roseivirga sp. E12]MBO3699784.1 nuclear transport factor 2 family protein [Roseivirga sp. E12]
MRRTILTLSACLCLSFIAFGQSDKEAVEATLMDYMDGTSKGQVARIKRAFTETAALYSVNPDGSQRRLPIAEYIGYFKEGQARDRVGKIISIDIVNNAAHAKVEIVSGNTKFTDYMLLLKLKDGWKIINKSFTREAIR